MSLFTIADLHLSGAADHPMDVFGDRWLGYTDKICRRWRSVVSENDTVILPGDISWGMTLDEAMPDFALLDGLPGQKLLGKGNHDFWWDTATKLTSFFDKNGFSTLKLLFNNAYRVESFIITGTRGWFLEESQQVTVGTVDYDKLIRREALRLERGLSAAAVLQKETPTSEILVFLHFPPVYGDFVCREMVDLLHRFGVRRCYYGHIHGVYTLPPCRMFEEIGFFPVSSDYLDFTPKKIL